MDILRRGCGSFRKILKDISGLDPLMESCTIAQACSKVWRKNYMPENCVARRISKPEKLLDQSGEMDSKYR